MKTKQIASYNVGKNNIVRVTKKGREFFAALCYVQTTGGVDFVMYEAGAPTGKGSTERAAIWSLQTTMALRGHPCASEVDALVGSFA